MPDAAVNPKDGAELVFVPAGEFQFGLNDTQVAEIRERFPGTAAGYLDLMRQEHPVTLPVFRIYKHPVTVAQYRAFCKATDRFMPDSPAHVYEWPLKWTDRHPVTYVADCAAYASWAGGTLPAEQQWEKAARGIDARFFPWGNEFDPVMLHSAIAPHPRYPSTPCPIGVYPQAASPFGIEDCCGNVAEWTSTQWNNDRLVLRGSTMHNLRREAHLVTARAHARAGDCLNLVGFRVVLG